jgi:hypothetical protein
MANESPNIFAYAIQALNHKKVTLMDNENLNCLPDTEYKCRILERAADIIRVAGKIELPPLDKRSGIVTVDGYSYQVKLDDEGVYHIFPAPNADKEYKQKIIDTFNAERGINVPPIHVDYSKTNHASITKNAFALLPAVIVACERNMEYLKTLPELGGLPYAIEILKKLKVFAIDNQPKEEK